MPPTLAARAKSSSIIQAVAQVLVDSGFASEAAVHAAETDAAGRPSGVPVLTVVKRARHGRTVAQLETPDAAQFPH